MIANESCWNCCLTTALRRAKALPVPPEKTEEMLAEIRRAADGCRGSESAPAMSAILTNVMKMYVRACHVRNSDKCHENVCRRR